MKYDGLDLMDLSLEQMGFFHLGIAVHMLRAAFGDEKFEAVIRHLGSDDYEIELRQPKRADS